MALIQRPSLLIRAATDLLYAHNRSTSTASQCYERARDLPRVLGTDAPEHGLAVDKLVAIENAFELQRAAGDPAYSMVAHVRALAALMDEQTYVPMRAKSEAAA